MTILKGKKKPYIIVNRFNRSGGEGLFTRVVTESNKSQFADLQRHLLEGENALIVYRRRAPDWVMLTNFRLIFQKGETITSLSQYDIMHVFFALEEEENRGVSSKLQFSLIKITSKDQQEYIIEVEPGKPFIAFLNALLFISKGD